jgi:phospholipase A1
MTVHPRHFSPLLAIALAAYASAASAQVRIVPEQPATIADAGAGVSVYLLNEGDSDAAEIPPATITVTTADGITLYLGAPRQDAVSIAPHGFARLTYRAVAQQQRVAVASAAPEPAAATPGDRPTETAALSAAGSTSGFLDRFRPHEPFYAVGGLGDAGLKVQASIALDPIAGDGVLSHIRLGYTQTFFWALDRPSGPIRATTYSPEAAFNYPIGSDTLVGIAYRHDSNGEGAATSVNSHRIIARIAQRLHYGNGWSATVAPSAWIFLGDRGVATDLPDYYGNFGLSASVEQADGIKLQVNARGNVSNGRGGVEGFLSYPLARFGLAGIYAFAQGWTGYGEALSDYDVSDQHIRVGLAVMR